MYTVASCNWVEHSMKFKKDLLIFLRFSNHRLVFKAGGYISMNYNTLVSIQKFAYSVLMVFSDKK